MSSSLHYSLAQAVVTWGSLLIGVFLQSVRTSHDVMEAWAHFFLPLPAGTETGVKTFHAQGILC